jgi:molybdopterin-guanine dinucleotide biosynthesis protein A
VNDEPFAAIVLCGGMSRRMGRPKAWLPFGNETLLQRTVRLLSDAADHVVVVAAPEQDLPPLPEDVTVARDPVPALGPLQGIAVGLAAAEPHARMAYVSPTDAPFVSTPFVQRMRALAAGHDIAMLSDGGYHHPLAAIYATRLHHEAAALLAAEKRRPVGLIDRAATRIVTRVDLLADPVLAASDPDLASLSNLNTPEDYEAALSRWRAHLLPK